ncbi:RICIN domain-containing protein [Jatrophihabitans sp. YIM 134969]
MIRAISTLSRRRMAAVRAGGDDRGSLVLAMLVTLVATSVAALVLPMLLTSASGARFDDRRARQLAAAQSGVETALARIRAASDSTSAGLIGSLPCAPLAGTVLGSVDLHYKVSITYYSTDPAQPGAAVVDCLTDTVGGVVKSLGTKTTPAFARITAWGSDVPGTAFPAGRSRSVSATYVVKTTNSNIVGGLFRVNKLATSKDLCLDAGAAPFTAGRVVTMQACDTTSAAQKWAYNTTLTVSLVATRVLDAAGAVTTDGLCVDGGPLTSGKEVAGTSLRLQACGTATNLSQQRWSMNDNAGMEGTDTGAATNGLCWGVTRPDVPGSDVTLGTKCVGSNGYDNQVSWQPAAAVGAGASGAAYNELVNYNQFGRCLDVTDQNVDSSFLIAWPCKQQPDPTKVAWNQRWTLPAVTDGVGTGRITTTRNGTTYCLTSPMSSGSGRYVRVTACPTTATDETRWTVRTKVSSYAASYQIEDRSGGLGAGLCLQPADPASFPVDLFEKGTGISKIVVRPCTASTLQKWNAPPNIDAPSVKDQTEN